MEEYRARREVVEGSMGVLCNLCVLRGNGESFVMMSGELGLLDTLFSDQESGDNVRLASASVLHNWQQTLTLLAFEQRRGHRFVGQNYTEGTCRFAIVFEYP
eukprot:295149_1